jgi:hypothetical protein
MNRLKIIVLVAISALLIPFISCQHEPELIPGTPEVCFDTEVQLIINSNCMMSGCHDGGGEMPALGSYDALYKLVEPGKPNKSKLHDVLTTNPNSEKFMPPKPKTALTSEQIDIISLWILQGAKNTVCGK